jgi:hypothetical protein
MSFAIELLRAQMDEGEGHSVLDRRVDHQVARAAGLRQWIDRTVEDDQKIDVTIFPGIPSRLRAEQNQPVETFPVEFPEVVTGVFESEPNRGSHLEISD